MNDTNAIPKDDVTSKNPDLTPRPVPAWEDVAHDVAKAKLWLSHVAADDEDPRAESAAFLLKTNAQTGQARLDDIAELAHRMIRNPLDVPLDQIEPFEVEMWQLIYEYSENSGGHASPLLFTAPNALLEVLEFTNIWKGVATERITAFSTRHLARLARVDVKTMEQQLDLEDIVYEPYGVSLREMAEMTAADQLFWYRQYFVFGFKDALSWLTKFPGFTSPTVHVDE